MNSLVITEAVLLIAAFTVAWQTAKKFKALGLASVLIGLAALLGLLKYSKILPLPELHQLMAVLSSTVALPLLAITVTWPEGRISRSIRYMAIFSFIAAFLGVMLVTLGGYEHWRTVCALCAVLTIIGVSVFRKQWMLLAAGLFLLFGLITLTKKLNFAGLLAADWMHLFLAVVLVLLGMHFRKSKKI